MQKNKLSFFERITGSVRAPEEMTEEADHNEQFFSSKEVVEESKDWIEEETEEGELPIDVYQTPQEIIVKSMIAGVRPDDLEISISREMVTIRGKRQEQHETSSDNFFHKELYWGSFSRTILLPAEVEAEEAEAIEKHGLLTIRLPKINKEKVSNLRVKSI